MTKRIAQLLLAGAMVAMAPALAKADGYGRNLWSGFGVQVVLSPQVVHRPPVMVHHKPVVLKHHHVHRKHWHRPPPFRHWAHHKHRDFRPDWDRRHRR